MLIKQGDSYMIAINRHFGIEQITEMRRAITDIIGIASNSDSWLNCGTTVYWLCELLDEMSLTTDQMIQISRGEIEKAFSLECQLEQL
jgi:hypothetical protein